MRSMRINRFCNISIFVRSVSLSIIGLYTKHRLVRCLELEVERTRFRAHGFAGFILFSIYAVYDQHFFGQLDKLFRS